MTYRHPALAALSTNFIGLGLVGLTGRLLVYPVQATWLGKLHIVGTDALALPSQGAENVTVVEFGIAWRV